MSGMSREDHVNGPRSSVKLTYEDFLEFPDDGQRHEIIDGEHYVSATPVPRHQLIVGNLHVHLRLFLDRTKLGTIFGSPVDTVLSQFDVIAPDLIYVSKERHAVIGDKNLVGAPDLVIEVLSPSTRRRDEVLKRRLFERTDVREYWTVDPKLEAIKIYRRDAAAFPLVADLSRERGDVVTTPLLPDFTLPLDKVFE